jgi:hypothetical protein
MPSIRALRFTLGAVVVCQLTLRHRFQHRQDIRIVLKALLNAA